MRTHEVFHDLVPLFWNKYFIKYNDHGKISLHYKYGKKYSVATLFKQRLYKRSLVLRPWNENNVNFCQNTCSMSTANPNNIYLFKVNNRNTIKRYKICSKLTIKTPERRQWRRSGVFIVNFENNSHLFLVFLLLTLNK